MTLSRCVPLPPVEFLSGIYGSRHLHTPAALLPDFTDLFTAATVDQLLTGSGLRTSSVRLVREGKEMPAPGITESGDSGDGPGYVDTDRVRSAIAAGCTLILRSLHRYHPPVRTLAHGLAAQLGSPVRVNAFVTPPEAVGVDLHYDVQDVFVLQIAGTKQWHLRASPLERPLPAQAWFDLPGAQRAAAREASRHLGDVVLRPGDSLYLPRGTMHAPRTQDQLSVHLTVAVSVLTRYDLLRHMIEYAGDDDWYREHIALTALEENPRAAAELLGEVAQRLLKAAAEIESPQLLWKVRRAAFRDLPPAPVAVLPSPSHDVGAGYHLRAGAQYAVTPIRDGLVLHTGGKQVTLPAAVAPVLTTLRRYGFVSHAALAEACGADDSVKLTELLLGLDIVTTDAEPE